MSAEPYRATLAHQSAEFRYAFDLRNELQSGHSDLISRSTENALVHRHLHPVRGVPVKSAARSSERKRLHMEEIYANSLTIAGIPKNGALPVAILS
jgi:hypothetical protein